MPMPDLIKDMSRLSLAEIGQYASDANLPPVDMWDPPFTGPSHVRIAQDGRWFHKGDLIIRENLVRLFASILRREADGGFMLVTPIEKQSVDVEDAPFIAIEVRSEGEGTARKLAFRTTIGDMVIADAEHHLRFESLADGPAPYILIRAGLEARIVRPVFYELAELALAEDAKPLGLWSHGSFFSMANLL
jgi:uncharacterized protein